MRSGQLIVKALLALAVLGASPLAAQERKAPPKVTRTVGLWVARDVAPGPRIRLTLNTQNVPVVQLRLFKLDAAAWLVKRAAFESLEDSKRPRPQPVGKAVRTWTVRMALKPERPDPYQVDRYRSRQVNLPPLPPGVYLVTAGAPGAAETWGVINITQLAVVVKRSPRKVLAWVTDHQSGAVVKGARVTLYTLAGKASASGSTGPDGVTIFAASPGREQTVVVQRGKDFAAVPSEIEDPDGQFRVHFQTDRPVYRPGHLVSYKAILRRTAGQGYAPLVNAACKVQVRDSKDTVLEEYERTTNSFGTVSGSIELPEECVTGQYTVVVSSGPDSAYGTFTVAEYRKPEFKIAVKPSRPRYLAGEDAQFEVEAAYYFGAPLPQASVRYAIRRSPTSYWYSSGDESDGWYAGGDGNLYPRDTYDSQPFVAEGQVFTDDQGRARIPFKTDPKAPDSTYTVSVTVTDGSNRQMEGSAGVPIYAASLRLGLRSALMVAPLGTLVPLQVTAADLDGRPVAARVELKAEKPVWDQKAGQTVYQLVDRTEVAVPLSGRVSATLPARAQGELRITAVATDETGRRTFTRLEIWVASPSYRPPKEETQPSIVLRPDRRTYTPGSRASVSVTTNTRRPMLLALEGADLWTYTVVPAARASTLWSFGTTLPMSPNAYVTASQWNPSDLLTASALIPIPDASRKLTVRIEPERTGYRPGEQANYLVRTLDEKGRGVPAEVAVSVVDEAIYAVRPDVTPDPLTFFWGLRQNLTQTLYSAPSEVSGGAYQRNNTLAPVRQRFLDTAHWNAHVTTGADGTARVSFQFPGNLTAWRATALAITEDSRTGRTTAQVRVSRPVMLRLATPRLIVQGDRLELAGTVNNRTETDREFIVRLQSEGLQLEGSGEKRLRVPAGGEGTVHWDLHAAELPTGGTASLEGSVAAADAAPDQRLDLSDALRVAVRVAPRGIEQRIAVGAAVEGERTLHLSLPADRIEPASKITVTVRTGLQGVARGLAAELLGRRGSGSSGAANRLLLAASVDQPDRKVVRDTLALISRFQKSDGWGWWEEDPSDPLLTARVVQALFAATSARLPVSPNVPVLGLEAVARHYAQTNLWEHRAVLAATLAFGGHRQGGPYLEEVLRRGTHMSPYARLLLAEALWRTDKKPEAEKLAGEVLGTAVIGPDHAYVPAGQREGWSASTVETTAQALLLLLRTERRPDLQRKLAEWLAAPEGDRWLSEDDQAAISRALLEYVRAHPQSTSAGPVEVLLNGARLQLPGREEAFTLAPNLLKDGDNAFTIRRSGEGEAFVTVEARVFRPAAAENAAGMRVLRRFEARSANGVWEEVHGPVKPGEPVRVTVVAWPMEQAKGIRIVQPIPAGFEYIESETGGYSREEVRDGAVIHYLSAHGTPQTFRYYLRAESEGRLVALPATGEVVRRPAERGNSALQELQVEEADAR